MGRKTKLSRSDSTDITGEPPNTCNDHSSADEDSDDGSIHEVEFLASEFLQKLKKKNKKPRGKSRKNNRDHGKDLLKRKAQDEAVRAFVNLTAPGAPRHLAVEHQRRSPHTSPRRQLGYAANKRRSPCTSPQTQLDCLANERRSPHTPPQRQLNCSANKRRSLCIPPQRQLDCSANERRSPRTPPRRQLDCSANERRSPRTPTRRQLDCSVNERRSPRTPPRRQPDCSVNERRSPRTPPRRQLDCSANERRSPRNPSRKQLDCSPNKSRSTRTPPPRQLDCPTNKRRSPCVPPPRQPDKADDGRSQDSTPSVAMSKEKERGISEPSTSGLSGNENEAALHEALTAMQSVVYLNMGIEERLHNCEKVLRLVLKVQVEALKSSLEEKREQENNGQLDPALKKQAREACKNASSSGDAIRNMARVLFTEEELLECSVRGRHTNKTVLQRRPLDATKLKFLESTVTKVYNDTSPTQVSSKLGDFLKKNRVKKAEKTDKCST
ncbi:SRRM2 protein homolog rsr-2-like [Montipora foliosa]|uniref:SRRM2 protein homolog rsr-2-like n=1 Tax=Montipora foliosa TaxID=591990 RepID=UPI0035F1407C